MHLVAIGFLSVVVCSMLVACATKRIDPFSVPILVVMMFSFFYIWQPVSSLLQGGLFDYVGPTQVTWSVVFAAWALLALLSGWFSFPDCRLTSRSSPREFTTDSAKKLFGVGLILCLCSFASWFFFVARSGGFMDFYAQAHGRAGNWEQSSGYVFLAPNIMVPGIAFMVIACVRGRIRSQPHVVALTFCACAFGVHAMLISSRGLFFELVVSISCSYFLASGRRPSFVKFLAGSVACGFMLLLIVHCRGVLHLGATWSDVRQIEFRNPGGVVTSMDAINPSGVGNEFIYHTGVLATMDKFRAYGYGTRYLLFCFMHPVPRAVWPSKPVDYLSLERIKDQIATLMGWVPAEGAAPGLVADMYIEWGMLSMVAWLLLGILFRVSYLYAAKPGSSPLAIMVYVVVLSRSLHLVSQGLIPFLEVVPLMLAPSLILYWLICPNATGYRFYPHRWRQSP